MFRCTRCNKFTIFLNKEKLCSDCKAAIEQEEVEKRIERMRKANEIARKRNEKIQADKKATMNYFKSIQELICKLPKYYDYIGTGTCLDDLSIHEIKNVIDPCQKLLDLLSDYKNRPMFYEVFKETSTVDEDNFSVIYDNPYFPGECRHYRGPYHESCSEEESIDDFIDKYINKIHYYLKKAKDAVFYTDIFDRYFANVAKAEIETNSANILTRIPLSEFQVPSTSNITKSSNRTSLQDFIVVDVETTGLKPSTDEIVQLCAVRFEGFDPVEAFITYVHPTVKMGASARAVNHISDNDLADAPSLSEVSEAFYKFIGKSLPLVGHNLLFDLKFLGCSGVPLGNKTRKKYDTLTLAKKVYDAEKYSLDSLCHSVLKVYRSTAHDALSDAIVTGMLFKNICNNICD